MSKPILFYSDFCEHSKALVTTILKYQLRNHFTIHCVDSSHNLPKDIDRVPMLMHENKLLSDEGLFNYIEQIAETASVKKNIAPFMVSEMGNSISDTYSYLEDDGATNIVHSFVHLKDGEQVNNERIYTPDDDSAVASDNKSTNYEDLLTRRENELSGFTASAIKT